MLEAVLTLAIVVASLYAVTHYLLAVVQTAVRRELRAERERNDQSETL